MKLDEMKRLYQYLKRFKEQDNIKIDILFVIANIIFGDTSISKQQIIKKTLIEEGFSF